MTPGSVTGIEAAWGHALADELAELTALLSDLANDLTADPATVRRHMHSLQAVDRVIQGQIAITGFLRAQDAPDHALTLATLGDMVDRLKERLAHHRTHAG